jgi:rubrerythrin
MKVKLESYECPKCGYTSVAVNPVICPECRKKGMLVKVLISKK